MVSKRPNHSVLSFFFIVAVALLLPGCTPEPEVQGHAPSDLPTLGHINAPLVTNGGFEDGTLNGWTVGLHTNGNGLANVPPLGLPDLLLSGGTWNLTSAVGGLQGTQIPAGLSPSSSLRYPKSGQWSAVINSLGDSYNSNSLKQSFTITNADVDPADGKVHLRFALALVFEDPGHPASQQPYFFAMVHNVSKGKQLSSMFAYSNQDGVIWKVDETGVLYTDWRSFDIIPKSTDLDIGDQVELTVVASGCGQGAHFGHVYVDDFGAFLPGMSITASAPAQINAGSELTYTYLVKNSGDDIATNVIVEQPLPANTTFAGINAPGATCTTPAIGATGVVSCNLGSLNPTASTTFQLTVTVDSGASGTVSNGTYTVRSDEYPVLAGPLVQTAITQGLVFADLVLTKTDGLAAVTWGQSVQYLIEVTNRGPSAVTGARVTDMLPAELTGASWTCTASNQGACGTPSGTGHLDAQVDLPVDAKAIFTLSAAVVGGSGVGRLSNLATVTVPSGMADSDLQNNQAVDTDSIGDLYQVIVNKAPGSTGTGTVITSPAAITCDAACMSTSAQFMDGTLVSATATAAPGSTFIGWTGACAGTANPCNFIVTGDMVLTAEFSVQIVPECTTSADCSAGHYCSAQGQCLLDVTPPVLQLPSPLVLEGTSPAGAAAHFTAMATDALSGPVPVVCTPVSGTTFALGTTVVTCSAQDIHGNTSSGTFPVTVVDTTPPLLRIAGSSQETLECGTPYVEQGASATDICSGDLSAVIVTTGAVDSSTVGSYTLHYEVTDRVGLTAALDRTVTVQDTLAPVIHMNPGPSVLECAGTPYQDPGATASDACSGDLTSNLVVSSNLNQSREGQYTISYSVVDAAGHASTVSRHLTVGSCCLNIRLSDYNLFLLEDYTGGHDVVGKVAAGGNITMTDFSVGMGLPDNGTSGTLVAGGNLTLSRGGVWGEARYGGRYRADPSVVYPRGGPAQGTPIDFAARFSELRRLSSRLNSMPANGSTSREVWGGIMLKGSDPAVNVFDVNASAFKTAKLFNIHAPAGALAVVNIRGASASLSGFSFTFSGGIDMHGVLFNFVDATHISASGIGIKGTVLAPYARVTFNNGSWDGGMYAVSLKGNAEGHINPLNDRDLCP
jgi:choice-of-anchor A domain-containing protein/uncharacterized repeat protein (TIGR01451 family)/uncharacterized repeat protein (TIGR02543 family)